MLSYLYSFFIILLETGIRIASIWNPKAKLWIAGRRNVFDHIQEKIKVFDNVLGPRIWMHCASLGEFEQGRPLLEKIRKTHPDAVIILSFFSPSGYEVRKNYAGADLVCYLPSDRLKNVKRLLNLIQPTLVLWIRYEFWHNYLRELKKRQVSVLLVSALFREQHLFFKSYGGFWRETLQVFEHIFVQNEDSADLLLEIGLKNNVTVSGDTRFDRVTEIADAFEPIPVIERFCAGHSVVVAGSTWQEDQEELVHYANTKRDIRFIIAPHEVDTENIRDMQKAFLGAVLYSELKDIMDNNEAHILIINNIGMLSRLYRYADIAYVGGGFGDDGLHNILEAAVYGKPVLFGPVFQKHYEAIDMIEAGGAITVENALDLEMVLNRLLNDPNELKERGDAAKLFVTKNVGATQTIMDYIQRNRLCTN